MAERAAGDVAGGRRQRAGRTAETGTVEQDAGARQWSGDHRVEGRSAVVAVGVEAVGVEVVVGVVRRPGELGEQQRPPARRIAHHDLVATRCPAPDRHRRQHAYGGVECPSPRATDEADARVQSVTGPHAAETVLELAAADVDGVECGRGRTPVHLRKPAHQLRAVAFDVAERGVGRRGGLKARQQRATIDLVPRVQPGEPQVDGAASQAVAGYAGRIDEVVDEESVLEADRLAAD